MQLSLDSDSPLLFVARFRSRWPVTQRGVRSDRVVVNAPAFRQHTQLFDRVEDFAVEELISEF
jgi:hypothetical protein